MSLSAQDIQSQQFHVRFRGFDAEEVDDFLEKVATAFQSLSEENRRVKEQAESLEKDLATYRNQQKAFQNAIVAAQSIADEMKEKSRIEAEEIVEAAHAEARRLLDEANGEVVALERELDRLTALKAQMREELSQQLNAYLEMIEAESFAAPQTARARTPLFAGSKDREEVYECTPPAPERSAEKPEKAAPAFAFAGAEAEVPESERPEEGEESDLSDLYVRVDLPEDVLDLPEEEGKGRRAQDIDLPPIEADEPEDLLSLGREAEEPAIPDLEGDMVFSLEDPLDEQGPSVSAWEDEEKKKKKEDFDPYESPL